MQRNWVFSTNSNFLIPISLQPEGENLWYFKFDLTEKIIVLNFKDLRRRVANIGKKMLELVAKTHFL